VVLEEALAAWLVLAMLDSVQSRVDGIADGGVQHRQLFVGQALGVEVLHGVAHDHGGDHRGKLQGVPIGA
jgi:hypothetical protein